MSSTAEVLGIVAPTTAGAAAFPAIFDDLLYDDPQGSEITHSPGQASIYADALPGEGAPSTDRGGPGAGWGPDSLARVSHGGQVPARRKPHIRILFNSPEATR